MKKRNSTAGNPNFGVLSTWFRGQYQLELVSGMETEAGKSNACMYYFSGRCLQSPVQYETFFNVIFDYIPVQSLDGLIIPALLANYCTDECLEEFISRFRSLPVITIGFQIKGAKAVLLNNENGFRELIRHIVEFHGYKKIAFIHGPPGNPNAQERFLMFRKVLASYNVGIDENMIVYGDFSYIAGRNCIKELFQKRGCRPGRDIEAIVASNDLMALGAMDQLKEIGIELPGSVAVTGFDNTLDARNCQPPLTTINQNAYETGILAVRNLVNYAHAEETVFSDTTLVIRNSCGCNSGYTGGKADTHRQHVLNHQKDVGPDAAGGEPDTVIKSHAISEFYFYQLIYVSDALKQVQTLAELEEWMHGGFKSLGISECYLFFYTDEPGTSPHIDLAAGYNSKGLVPDKIKKTYDFPSIMGSLLENAGTTSYCIVPILFRDEQFGFMVMSVNLKTWIAYETIRSQVSSSLKSIFMVENIRKMNRKLTQTNARLKLSEEQKTRFFINLAHETKTPLTLIQNYLGKYMRGHEHNDDLLVIKQNIDFLLENMAVFLDVEKLEKGKILYNHNRIIDLSMMMKNKVMVFSEVAGKKRISISSDIADTVSVKADPWAMDRVLNNLLDNAVKYTPEKGKISISLEKKNDTAVLEVKDSGHGIAEDKIRHIFKPYYQLVNPGKSNQGIGMGLYIVKKILDELGARIRVTAEEGKGSCFTIIMNISAEKPDDTLFADPKVSRILPGLRYAKEINEENLSPGKHSILIVDDNVSMLSFLRDSFRDTYNVYLAADVRNAFIKLKAMPAPEIIISDIMMDEIDGHEFLAMLRENEKYSDIAFIFLTAKQAKNEKIKGLAGGAIDFIEKPFAVEELAKKIESIISMRSRQRKKEATSIRKKLQTALSEIDQADTNVSRDNTDRINEFCITHRISGREKEIILLKQKGLINKEIAVKLNITLRTVEYHITNIYKKLDISDNYALLQLFNTMK